MSCIRAPSGKPIRIVKWLVKVGDTVRNGTKVLSYRPIENSSSSGKELNLRSDAIGTIKTLYSDRPGQAAEAGSVLIELEGGCAHTTVIREMCAECGKDLKGLKLESKHSAHVSMVPNVPELKISAEQAEELGQEDKKELHNRKKLALLVDLDQTVIHTTQNPQHASIAAKNQDVYTFQLQRHDPVLYTKLRPGCRKFLVEMSELYQLQIVTFGSRQYAHKIASFIDPDQKLFGSRILSRDECFNPQKKSSNLKHLFPCGPSMVCIIDDRDDVWNGATNLVLVKKYSFFPGSGDINNPDKFVGSKTSQNEPKHKHPNRKRKSETDDENDSPKKVTKGEVKAVEAGGEEVADDEGKMDLHSDQSTSSSNEAKDDQASSKGENGKESTGGGDGVSNGGAKSAEQKTETAAAAAATDGVLQDTDDYLDRLQEILTEVHHTYYEAYDKYVAQKFEDIPDIRGIVPFIRSKVLYDCVLVMTGIVPHNYRFPHGQHRVYVIATQLGAKIDEEVTDKTTHLICGKKGTMKYQNAVKFGNKKIHFVSADWLIACSEKWQKLSESDYPIKTLKNRRNSAETESKSSPNADIISPAVLDVSRYDPFTGKLLKKVKDPRFEFRVHEAVDRLHNKKLTNPIFSSLNHPTAVIPISNTPPTPMIIAEPSLLLTTAGSPTMVVTSGRERKASMAEMIPIDVMLSSSDIAFMKADVGEDLDDSSSSDEEKEEELGTKIEGGKPTKSRDYDDDDRVGDNSTSDDSDDDDGADDEYGQMAQMMEAELEYDEDDAD